MSALLSTLVGSGLDQLRQACGNRDSRLAYHILRTGTGVNQQLAPAAAAIATDWPSSWYAITRMSEPAEPPGAQPFPVLLDVAHYLRGPLAIVISRDAGQFRVHLGMAEDETPAWTQRVLAPDVLLSAVEAPAACRQPVWLAVRFRPAPTADRAGTEQPVVAVSLLDRLAAVEDGCWAVVLHCVPAAPRELHDAISELTAMRAAAAASAQTSTMLDEVTHIQRSDPAADAVVDWLAMLVADFQAMAAGRAWRTQTMIHADSQFGAHLLAAALTAVGPQDPRGPSRTWLPDVLSTAAGSAGQPLVGLHSSNQIATWLAPPRAASGTLSVGAALPPGRISLPMRRELRLGNWLGTTELASIDVDDLSGHAFIAGVTGSGKSTTLLRLLLPLWQAHRIPFLIIDPVKDDYRELSGVFGGLQIVPGAELRLNALRPRPDTDPSVHLDQVGAAFKGAFSMPSPIPYVVSLLLDELRPALERGEQLTLHDLRRLVRPLIGRLGYRGELEGNILASLETRLSILTAPHRAERFCADHDSLQQLFDRPTVVTLCDLGDDEERAFVMALLMIYVAQNARGGGPHPAVRHLTVIEEAHRLVGQPSGPGPTADTGDAAGYAARLVAQLLAEIRSYGESIVLLDQSPAAVAREVLRNTNTKILHRVLDPADRELVAGAVGLSAEEADFLADLGSGQALVAHVRLPRPQLIQVAPPPPILPANVIAAPPPVGRRCCGNDPVRHHRAQAAAADAAQIVTAALSGCLVRPQRDRTSVTLLAAGQLSQLAVQLDLADASCLGSIGTRAAAEAWVSAGWLARPAAEQFVARVVDCLAGGGTGALELPPVPAARLRPYRGCDGCRHACLVRPIARGHPARSAIKDAIARRAGADTEGVLAEFRKGFIEEYQPVLDSEGAADVANCIVLHAVGDQSAGERR